MSQYPTFTVFNSQDDLYFSSSRPPASSSMSSSTTMTRKGHQPGLISAMMRVADSNSCIYKIPWILFIGGHHTIQDVYQVNNFDTERFGYIGDGLVLLKLIQKAK